MTKTLTQLIAVVQANLLDDGTRFTTATVTAAVRSALKEFNQRAPNNQAELIDTVANQKDYELTDFDSRAMRLTGVYLWDEDADDHEPLPYDDWMEDARIFFRLKTAQPADELILARYQIPFTVSGLDSETESTLPVFWDNILEDGATFYACQIRSSGRIETINLNEKVSENWIDIKKIYRKAFDNGLELAARTKAPVSEPDTSAWNDPWHGWDK